MLHANSIASCTDAPTREVYSESSIFLGRGNALVTEICIQDHTDVSKSGGHMDLEKLQDIAILTYALLVQRSWTSSGSSSSRKMRRLLCNQQDRWYK